MIITSITIAELRTSGIQAAELLRLLPGSSREKLERIMNPDSYGRSLLGEILARYTISRFAGLGNTDIHFNIAEKGKPHLKDFPGIHFNITHSGDMVACAASCLEIGIDIELFRKVNFRVAERFFSPPEIGDLLALDEAARMDYFFTLWTIKESFLKAIGSGLTRNLNSFTVVRAKDGFILDGDELSRSYFLKTFQLPGQYHLAVCSKEQAFPDEVQIVSIEEIVKLLV
jgi:4'-phosphopantetheinyl transferase